MPLTLFKESWVCGPMAPLWMFHEVHAPNCRYTLMDAQSTTIMSVVLAIVIGYFAGRAFNV